MRRLVTRGVWLLLAGSLACAYYNGLYNANRLAGDARRAEEEGRSGEARSLWSQAAVKAESVATRYTDSKWRDDALLLWGVGLKESGLCRRALRPLRIAVDSSPDPKMRHRARVELGDCMLIEGQPDSAVAHLTPVVAQDDERLAARARLLRGRAELELGNYEEAIADLELADPEAAAFDLSRAHLASGSTDEAVSVLAARVPGSYDEAEWLAALDTLGRLDGAAASDLVDRLAPRTDLTAGQRARLFLGDGRRLAAAAELEPAIQRFALATAAAPDSTAGIAASAEMALAELRLGADVSRLPDLVAQMEASQRGGPEAWGEIRPYLAALRVAAMVVRQPLVDPGGALLFGAAEFVRDSLPSATLAAAMFWHVYEAHPESFVAPKALLAAAAIDWQRADTAMALLDALYAESPYRLALAGEGAEEFRLAEDSLRVLIVAGLRAVEGRGGVILEASEEELRRDR